MPISNIPKNPNYGTLKIEDNTGTPIVVTARMEQGDLAVSDLNLYLNETVFPNARGKALPAITGDRRSPEVSFTAHFSEFTGDGSNFSTVLKSGTFASGVSFNGTGTKQVMAYKFTYTVEGTDLGDAADHTLVLNNCIFTGVSFSEGYPTSTASFTAVVRGSVVIDGTVTRNEFSI